MHVAVVVRVADIAKRATMTIITPRLTRTCIVTFVYCIQTAKDVVKLLSRPEKERAPHSLSSSEGNPLIGALNTRGVGKICDFRPKSRLSQKRYEIYPWLLWNVNRKS